MNLLLTTTFQHTYQPTSVISSQPIIIFVKLRSFAGGGRQSPSKGFQIYQSIRSRKALTKANEHIMKHEHKNNCKSLTQKCDR